MWQPDNQKMKELILHISIRSESDEYFGATKLNKLLFYSDFDAYLKFQTPITGQEYMALEQGPVPRKLVPIRTEMMAQKELLIITRDIFGYEQQKPIALRAPRLDVFSAREIALVDKVIADFWHKTATQVSQDSHYFIGWKLAKLKERIPYQVALLGNRPPTKAEFEYGLSLDSLAKQCLGEG